ncbi:NAD(P)-binding protein [Mytilinidion resinicola]|uniref:NAD(P)-binding protein n=1 Tax=Mytilinidion resinicola TaxID=574789 RepID=A0A6A6YG85_9PEZI|nr:NAD(P)-binding protein [Mytilinidion resinicola]KAF2807812.1 NAD(P)-binding protein [Mytilinidion resinicola]
MAHRILITGGSGYLGGTLLARWKEANFLSYEKLFALVRTEEQGKAVKQYGAEALHINLEDPESIKKAVLDHKINIVFYLVDPRNWEHQVSFIEALSELKKQTGQEVHFLHTSGAKIFSEHAGAPTDAPLLDTDPKLYDIQKSQKAPFPLLQRAVETNNLVIEDAEAKGVRSYIFAPCIVYGKGEGFGNPISIQTVAIVQAAIKVRQVYKVDVGRPTWPVCHVIDNTTLYIELLRAILSGKEPGYGKNGYYLASPGSVAWDDIYSSMAKALAKGKYIDNDVVKEADDKELQKMGDALKCPKDFVPVQLGGLCTFTAVHGKQIGWRPQFAPEHIIETADAEVELILQHLKE